VKNYDPNDIEGDISFYEKEEQNKVKQAFNNAVAQGSPYDLELPFNTATAPDDERGPETGSATVLIVEDEISILRLAKRILERLGYTVLESSTPGRAMDLAQEHAGEIHLLITDVVMPEMNGRELAERLQSLYPDLKVLFMSGYTADVIAHRGMLDAGVHFIQKPFSIRDLAINVREALGDWERSI